MQRTVYKYTLVLKEGDKHTIEMPTGAQVIYVGMQGKNICLWATVNPLAEEKQDRYFQIVGTGHTFEDTFTTVHVGTVQHTISNEWGEHEFVWHIFEQERF